MRRRGSTRTVREHMALRAEEHGAFWSGRCTLPADAARIERKAAAMAARWRSDERMYCGAWELPTWARGSIRAGLSLWVNGDGTIDRPGIGDGLADVVLLASRRPPTD